MVASMAVLKADLWAVCLVAPKAVYLAVLMVVLKADWKAVWKAACSVEWRVAC